MGTAPAAAHARLTGANPAPGAVLAAAPPSITLTFDEEISPQFSFVHVLARDGQEWSAGSPTPRGGDRTLLGVALRPDLPRGTYTVVWRAFSAVDGHVTQGRFSFTVQPPGGARPAPPAPGAAGPADATTSGTESPPPPAGRWFWRALVLISAAGLLGGVLFRRLVLPAAGAADLAGLARVLDRRMAVLMTALAALLLAALGADMLYQVAALTGSTVLGALADLDVARQVVAGTGFGLFWLLKVAGAVALLGYSSFRLGGGSRAEWTPVVVGAGLVLAGEALGSHEAAARPLAGLPLGVLSDLLHLLAAGAWAGGLLYLAVVLLPVLPRTGPAAGASLLAHLVPRFSALALASVAVLVLTGLVDLALHTLDPAAILASDSGRVLILKHLLFLPLLALGALNNPLTRPLLVALRAPRGVAAAGQGVAGFARLVAVETALMAGVLLCAAGLTLLPPPEPVLGAVAAPAAGAGQPAPTPGAPSPPPATSSQRLDGVRFDLSVRPDPAGDHFEVTVTRLDPASPPLGDVFKLQMQVIPQDIDAGSTSLPVVRDGSAGADEQRYTASAPVLTLDGGYQLNVTLLRLQSDDLKAGFHLALARNRLTITRSDVLQALITFRPSPPVAGPAQVDVHVVDGQGRPLLGLTVTLAPTGPVPAAPAAVVATPVAGRPGFYTARLSFPQPGAWTLTATLARPDEPPVRVRTAIVVGGPVPAVP